MNVEGSPPVRMLWESVDAGDALRKRFGFRSADAAVDWVRDAVGSAWDLEVDGCDELVISSWNAMAWLSAGGRRLIAKWSAVPQRFARLEHAAAVAEWLHGQGIPTAAPIPSVDGRRLVEVRNEARGALRSRVPLPGSRFLVGLLPVLDGDLLDVEDPTQVADAGLMLAELHEALARCPEQGPASGRPRHEGEQLVHHDFRSAKVLHDGTAITAVLDLEELAYDTRVADLAHSAVHLGCRYHDWGPTSADVRARFVDSYASRIPLTAADRLEVEARISAGLAEKGWR